MNTITKAKVPSVLLGFPNWVAYRLVPSKDRPGKTDKLPVNPHNGGLASSTDPATWGTFEQAMARAKRDNLPGVGFVFTNSPACGVDLDGCRDPETGEIEAWAWAYIRLLDTYTEVSPSGKGIHVLALSDLPPGRRKKGRVEMYSTGRFFTFTGLHIEGTPPTVNERTEALAMLHRLVFGEAQPKAEATKRPAISPLPDDRELIAKIRHSDQATKFEALWSGDFPGYPSQSEADLALCCILAFWTRGDESQMDRLFRQSGLAREKWDQKRGPQTYGQITISRALEGRTEFYNPPGGDGQREGVTALSDEETKQPLADLPTIFTTDRHLQHITADALDAVLTHNIAPVIFVRAGRLTRVVEDENRHAVAEPLDVDSTRGLLERVARFVHTVSKKGGEKVEKPKAPPLVVVRDLLALAAWPGIPPLAGIVTAPTFAADGTLNTAPGYHAKGRLFYHTGGGNLPIGDTTPTDEAVEKAKTLICDDLLGDFPFIDDASKANAVALLLLPFVQPMIKGSVPLHLIDGPTPGTGKGLLSEVVTIPFAPTGATVTAAAKDEEEWRKRITALLTAGRSHVLIDNVQYKLRSASLAAVITARFWEDRVLGRSEMVRLPARCIWTATGNNLMLSDELTRRSVWIRLDAKMERPWQRTKFKHPELLAWVQDNRMAIVTACLTLIRKWIESGRQPGQSPFGGFEDWSRVIGGILATIGIEGFLANAEALWERINVDRSAWAEFLEAWWEEHGGAPVGVKELFTLASTPDSREDCPGEDILALQLGAGNEKGRRVKLGYLLREKTDRVFGDYRIEAVGTKQRIAKYQLVKREEEG